MTSVPLGVSVAPTTSAASSMPMSMSMPVHKSKAPLSQSQSVYNLKKPSLYPSNLSPSYHSKLGACAASQMVELFPTVSPDVVVREARLEDCWEVAETHCSSFFPNYSFPLDFMLRADRLVAMISGLYVPSGCRRVLLVAITDRSANEAVCYGGEDFKIRGLEGKFGLDKGYVTGILTVDTVADFLPRKGPLQQRRTAIAYISNVAVREKFRGKGIAKKLVAKAEAQAKSWGCRAIALHCDLNNLAATKLYKGQGFKCIRVPEGATWPQPKTTPDVNFSFMMKLLHAQNNTALAS